MSRKGALRDFPVAPLQPIMRARYVDSSDPRTKFRPTADPANGTGVSALARTFRLSGHTARRWMTDGLTFFEADNAAGTFGGTIFDLWPEEVAAADLADDIVALVLAGDRARDRAWVRRYLDTCSRATTSPPAVARRDRTPVAAAAPPSP